MKNFKRSAVILFLLISGCTLSQVQVQAEDMYIKAAELRKLSAAVESTVRYKNPSPELSDDELLKLSTTHNSVLLTSFSDYKLRVDRRDNYAVILVCAQEGDKALLEDASCTGPLDAHHWQKDIPLPCQFTIQAASVC